MGDVEWERLPEAAPAGGWRVLDEQIVADQRGVVWDLIKQLGQTITQGVSLTRIAIPIYIAEPRSYLEMVADGWCYAPIFLKQAAVETNPVERMKMVVTFAIAGLSNTCTSKKPLNPILGETFEATFDDGTQIFCEQVSHHPPITNWEVVGPQEMYTFYGSGELTAAFRGNSIRGHQAGVHYIDFHMNGGRITYELPEVWVRGIMFGERIIEYDGLVSFHDKQNKVIAEVKINPEVGGWFSWKKKLPTDYLDGNIFTYTNSPADKKPVSKIEGSWLGCVLFDREKFWSIKDGTPIFKANPVENPLPSDSRFRKDIIHLKQKEIELAGEWKHKLEEIQRHEARLRKEYTAANGIDFVPS